MQRSFIILGIFLIISCTSNPEYSAHSSKTLQPVITPTPAPAPKLKMFPDAEENYITQPGDCWIKTATKTIPIGSSFVTTIHGNSGTQKLAAYGFTVYYDSRFIEIDKSKGSHNIEAGKDGFIAAMNNNDPNKIQIGGFDARGKGPGNDLEIVILYWNAKKKGNSSIALEIHTLVDISTIKIGNPQGYGIRIQIE